MDSTVGRSSRAGMTTSRRWRVDDDFDKE